MNKAAQMAGTLRRLYHWENHPPCEWSNDSIHHDICMYQTSLFIQYKANQLAANGPEVRNAVQSLAAEALECCQKATGDTSRGRWAHIHQECNGLLVALDRVQSCLLRHESLGEYWTREGTPT